MTLLEIADLVKQAAEALNARASTPFERIWVEHLRVDARHLRLLAESDKTQ